MFNSTSINPFTKPLVNQIQTNPYVGPWSNQNSLLPKLVNQTPTSFENQHSTKTHPSIEVHTNCTGPIRPLDTHHRTV